MSLRNRADSSGRASPAASSEWQWTSCYYCWFQGKPPSSPSWSSRQPDISPRRRSNRQRIALKKHLKSPILVLSFCIHGKFCKFYRRVLYFRRNHLANVLGTWFFLSATRLNKRRLKPFEGTSWEADKRCQSALLIQCLRNLGLLYMVWRRKPRPSHGLRVEQDSPPHRSHRDIHDADNTHKGIQDLEIVCKRVKSPYSPLFFRFRKTLNM